MGRYSSFFISRFRFRIYHAPAPSARITIMTTAMSSGSDRKSDCPGHCRHLAFWAAKIRIVGTDTDFKRGWRCKILFRDRCIRKRGIGHIEFLHSHYRPGFLCGRDRSSGRGQAETGKHEDSKYKNYRPFAHGNQALVNRNSTGHTMRLAVKTATFFADDSPLPGPPPQFLFVKISALTERGFITE